MRSDRGWALIRNAWRRLVSHFDLAQKKQKIEELTAQTMQEDFWNDPQQAQTVIRRLNGIREVVENYEKLEASLANLEESGELLKEDMDEDILDIYKWYIWI